MLTWNRRNREYVATPSHLHRVARPAIPLFHARRDQQPDAFVVLVGHGDVRLDAGVDGVELGAQHGAVALVDPEPSVHRQVAAAGRGDECRPTRLANSIIDARIGVVALPSLNAKRWRWRSVQKRQRAASAC